MVRVKTVFRFKVELNTKQDLDATDGNTDMNILYQYLNNLLNM